MTESSVFPLYMVFLKLVCLFVEVPRVVLFGYHHSKVLFAAVENTEFIARLIKFASNHAPRPFFKLKK